MLVGAFLALVAAVLVAAAPSTSPPPVDAAGLSATQAAPDIAARLAKWKPIDMPWDEKALSPRERQMVERLVAACRELESVYWRQSDPQALALYLGLAGRADASSQQLRRMLWIDGSRYDLLEENKPFVGTSGPPPGRALYPTDLSRADFDRYLDAHPAERQ